MRLVRYFIVLFNYSMSRAKKIFFSLVYNIPGENFRKWLLQPFGWVPVQLSEFDEGIIEKSILLALPADYKIQAPCWIDETTLLQTGKFPAVFAHVLQQGVISAYSPAVLKKNRLYLPKHLSGSYPRNRTDSDGLFEFGKYFLVGRANPNIQIDKGIMIGGAGAYNWYHFMIDFLPKAYLAQLLPAEYDDFPLLVPDQCRHIPSFTSALRLFSEGRQLIYMRPGDYALVDRLIIIDDLSIGPFNLDVGEWPRIDDYSQHEIVLHEFATNLRSKLLKDHIAGRQNRRIFLSRPSLRRDYNQNELIEIAENYGFETVNLELLTLEQQAIIFSESAAVVGASGAAWVGMIFQDRPLVGLSWLPIQYKEFCAYSALGNFLGHRIKFIEAKTEHPLQSTREAYTAKYQICPVEFDKALQGILEEIS